MVVYILVCTYIVVYILVYTYRAVGRVVTEGCGEDKIREADAPAFLRHPSASVSIGVVNNIREAHAPAFLRERRVSTHIGYI